MIRRDAFVINYNLTPFNSSPFFIRCHPTHATRAVSTIYKKKCTDLQSKGPWPAEALLANPPVAYSSNCCTSNPDPTVDGLQLEGRDVTTDLWRPETRLQV